MNIFNRDVIGGVLIALLFAIGSSAVQAGKAGGGSGADRPDTSVR